MVRSGVTVDVIVCTENTSRLQESRMALMGLGCNQLHGLDFQDTMVGMSYPG